MWLTPAEFKKTMIYKLVYALVRYMHDSMTPQIKSTHATGCLAQHSFYLYSFIQEGTYIQSLALSAEKRFTDLRRAQSHRRGLPTPLRLSTCPPHKLFALHH